MNVLLPRTSLSEMADQSMGHFFLGLDLEVKTLHVLVQVTGTPELRPLSPPSGGSQHGPREGLLF